MIVSPLMTFGIIIKDLDWVLDRELYGAITQDLVDKNLDVLLTPFDLMEAQLKDEYGNN